jgi:hypothetical protein
LKSSANDVEFIKVHREREMTNIDPTKREQADDNETHSPRWRLPVIVVGAVIGMLLWLLLDHAIPQ